MSTPTVFYNGGCPVCRREIEHYRDVARAAGAEVAFADVGRDPGALAASGLDGEAPRRRLHVRDADGRLLVGVPAFAAIWRRLPRYRWLARLVELPGMGALTRWLYEPVAAGLYRWDRRRRAAQASTDQAPGKRRTAA
jgi:predicted DCC family thiol-disulfide oxidoreductase YuxK